MRLFAPIPAPKLTSSSVTLSVDNRVALESGNLITLGPVILSVVIVTWPAVLPLFFKTGVNKVLFERF